MKSAVRTGVFGIIIAVLIVSFYLYLSRRLPAGGEETKRPEKVSTMDQVLEKDFTAEYPGTARSVIQWYNKIVLLMHDKETEDREMVDLCDQARALFDEELLAQNPRDSYIAAVKTDAETFENAGRKIASASVCDSGDVVYFSNGGRNYAYVIASYFETEGSGYTRVYQKYCLRTDSDNHWKIVAFQLCDREGNITGNVLLPVAN